MLNNLRVKSVLLSFALFFSFGFGQEFSGTVDVTGGDSGYELTFGFNPDGSVVEEGAFDLHG